MMIPSIEAGSYTDAECLKVRYGPAGRIYNSGFSDEVDTTLTITRDGDLVSGSLEGELCAFIGNVSVGGTVTPNYDCRSVTLTGFFSKIEVEQAPCDCSAAEPTSETTCDVGICIEGTCTTQSCPSTASVCTPT
jgi:hypothetical protein